MSLHSQLAQQALTRPEQPALLAHGRPSMDYRGLERQVGELAARLRALGIGAQDPVAIALPNGPELAVMCLAVMAAAIAVPVNPDWRQAEYETMFARIRPRLLITLAGIDHPSKAAAATTGVRVSEIEIRPELPAGSCSLSAGLAVAAERPDPAGGDVALILQTSGTTALPKIVPLTHGNLRASVANLQRSLRLGPDDRVLHFLPMFHIGGIVDVLLAPLLAGGSVVCCKSFSTRDFFRDLQEFAPTWVQTIPFMTQEILATRADHADIVSGHRLKFLRSVSAPLPVPLMRSFEEVFRIPVIEIFGMTETAGVITSNPLPPGERKPGSVGLPAGPAVQILNDAGLPLPPMQLGEVVVRGGNVMGGYQDDPGTNAQILVAGALHTGDIGYLDDDGYLHLVGRIKDIINRGGEKVSPQEVDRVLIAHPDVEDAACFPVPHPALGEEVAAIVRMRAGAPFDREALLSHLRAQLAFYKIPRFLSAVDQIPRNNGKIQRAQLGARFAADFDADPALQVAFKAAESPVARMIAASWEKILKRSPIGIDDDFFNIGGDSLKAASFINEMQQQWGETLYVSSLFDAPTIAAYESYLRQHYPEVIARMLGASIAPVADEAPGVSAEMVASLRAGIAHPRPCSPPAARKNPRAVFILSAPRSGSTLMRVMLAGHPRLFSPPELYLLSFDTMAERKAWYSGSQRFQLEGNIRALLELRNEPLEQVQQFVADLEARDFPVQEYYRLLQDMLGDRILTDKTPAYAIDPATLQRAEACFDEPFYIHLVRHPYGMIRSFEEAKLEQLWYPRLVGGKAGESSWTRRQLAEMIWIILNDNISGFLQHVPAHRQMFLRFEDMVARPEQSMRTLCSRLGLDYAPGMIRPQQEGKARMTDGIHRASRMIGDPKFHQHSSIDPAVAEQWKSAYEADFLSPPALALAQRLGYEETVASVNGRVEFDL